MNQLIIQYNYLGQWSRKYSAIPYREYKTLSIPRSMWNKERMIVECRYRKKWFMSYYINYMGDYVYLPF